MKRGMILNGRHRVYVGKEIMTIETSWGYPYTLYKEYNGTRYFADASEGLTKLRKSMHQVIRKPLRYSVIS